MEISEMLSLVSTPFGIGLVGLFLTQFVIDRVSLEKRGKVFVSWAIGIVLSGVMLAAGKFVNFGAYAVFEFGSWQDWATFGVIALMPGLISNGIFSSKILESVLSLIRK